MGSARTKRRQVGKQIEMDRLPDEYVKIRIYICIWTAYRYVLLTLPPPKGDLFPNGKTVSFDLGEVKNLSFLQNKRKEEMHFVVRQDTGDTLDHGEKVNLFYLNLYGRGLMTRQQRTRKGVLFLSRRSPGFLHLLSSIVYLHRTPGKRCLFPHFLIFPIFSRALDRHFPFLPSDRFLSPSLHSSTTFLLLVLVPLPHLLPVLVLGVRLSYDDSSCQVGQLQNHVGWGGGLGAPSASFSARERRLNRYGSPDQANVREKLCSFLFLTNDEEEAHRSFSLGCFFLSFLVFPSIRPSSLFSSTAAGIAGLSFFSPGPPRLFTFGAFIIYRSS